MCSNLVICYQQQKQATRRKTDLDNKIQAQLHHKPTIVVAQENPTRTQVSSTGWIGKELRFRDDRDLVMKAWSDGSILSVMKELHFQFVFFEG